jgi:hypothetical protein
MYRADKGTVLSLLMKLMMTGFVSLMKQYSVVSSQEGDIQKHT